MAESSEFDPPVVYLLGLSSPTIYNFEMFFYSLQSLRSISQNTHWQKTTISRKYFKRLF